MKGFSELFYDADYDNDNPVRSGDKKVRYKMNIS